MRGAPTVVGYRVRSVKVMSACAGPLAWYDVRDGDSDRLPCALVYCEHCDDVLIAGGGAAIDHDHVGTPLVNGDDT